MSDALVRQAKEDALRQELDQSVKDAADMRARVAELEDQSSRASAIQQANPCQRVQCGRNNAAHLKDLLFQYLIEVCG